MSAWWIRPKIWRRWVGAIALNAGVFGLGSFSFAIAPAAHTINPTYDSVVRVLKDTGLPGGQGFFEGTGSVVANTNVNGSGFLWVLTADHVVSSNGTATGGLANGIGLAFGNSPTSSGNSVYYQNAKALVADIHRGGPTGLEDMAVFGINYGAFDASKSALAVNLLTATGTTLFTDIGFGNEGSVGGTGYQAQNRYGTQRWFNERVFQQSANFQLAGYKYTAAKFAVEDPNDPTSTVGAGAAMDADSGSPMFTAASNGTYFTNGQFALLTGVSPAPTNGLYEYGSTEFGLA